MDERSIEAMLTQVSRRLDRMNDCLNDIKSGFNDQRVACEHRLTAIERDQIAPATYEKFLSKPFIVAAGFLVLCLGSFASLIIAAQSAPEALLQAAVGLITK